MIFFNRINPNRFGYRTAIRIGKPFVCSADVMSSIDLDVAENNIITKYDTTINSTSTRKNIITISKITNHERIQLKNPYAKKSNSPYKCLDLCGMHSEQMVKKREQTGQEPLALGEILQKYRNHLKKLLLPSLQYLQEDELSCQIKLFRVSDNGDKYTKHTSTNYAITILHHMNEHHNEHLLYASFGLFL
uniref:Uncharacterized protein n=1 Tax=Glossina pallidipes TaxID=7398 RepID=A0A1A9ZBT0_GLOPL